jgi:hypothetical protein
VVMELPKYIEAPIRERMQKVIATVSANLPEQLEEAFSSSVSGEGGPIYPAIWLFTQNLVVEIRNPLNRDRIQHDLAPFAGIVDWIRLNARKYDFGDPGEDSQLELEFTTTGGLAGTLLATGQGCPHLMEVYRRRFLTNFTGTQAK